jgi:flavin reductase (DIM6/NTAB) family NADH-FMN oxidoreductase RutF
MRQFVSGVCVVTADLGRERTGTTVTSVTSLSIDPPKMLVCLNRAGTILPTIRRYRHFCVNVPAADHQDVADRFAGRDGAKGTARYAAGRCSELATGTAALEGVLAAIDCDFDHDSEWHSHAFVLGAVKALRVGYGDALVCSRGRYGFYPAPCRHGRKVVSPSSVELASET